MRKLNDLICGEVKHGSASSEGTAKANGLVFEGILACSRNPTENFGLNRPSFPNSYLSEPFTSIS